MNLFWKIHFNKWNIPKYSLLSFTIFFDLEEMIFENFNISENNIISVKLAKVLGYNDQQILSLVRGFSVGNIHATP
jgi:hypothetical protein